MISQGSFKTSHVSLLLGMGIDDLGCPSNQEQAATANLGTSFLGIAQSSRIRGKSITTTWLGEFGASLSLINHYKLLLTIAIQNFKPFFAMPLLTIERYIDRESKVDLLTKGSRKPVRVCHVLRSNTPRLLESQSCASPKALDVKTGSQAEPKKKQPAIAELWKQTRLSCS